jgi:hypothetical protein
MTSDYYYLHGDCCVQLSTLSKCEQEVKFSLRSVGEAALIDTRLTRLNVTATSYTRTDEHIILAVSRGTYGCSHRAAQARSLIPRIILSPHPLFQPKTSLVQT